MLDSSRAVTFFIEVRKVFEQESSPKTIPIFGKRYEMLATRALDCVNQARMLGGNSDDEFSGGLFVGRNNCDLDNYIHRRPGKSNVT